MSPFSRVQVPMPEDQGRIGVQNAHFQAGKVELAHRLAVGVTPYGSGPEPRQSLV